MLQGASNDGLRRHVLARVDNIKAVVAQQQGHNIFANIVNVALHRGHDDDRPFFRPAPGFEHGLQMGEGRLHGFRFKDWGDHKSCLPSQTPGPTDQPIGTGNGSTTEFQLAKRYTSGAQSWTRAIAKPVAGTMTIGSGPFGPQIDVTGTGDIGRLGGQVERILTSQLEEYGIDLHDGLGERANEPIVAPDRTVQKAMRYTVDGNDHIWYGDMDGQLVNILIVHF